MHKHTHTLLKGSSQIAWNGNDARDERWRKKEVKSRPINDPYHQQTDVGRPNKRLRFHFVRTAQNNKSRNENDLFDTFSASIVVVSSDARNSPYALARIAFVAKRLLLFCVCARVAAGLRNWTISSLARKDFATLSLVLRQQTTFASSNGIHFDIVSESKSSFERYLLDRKTSRLLLLFNSTAVRIVRSWKMLAYFVHKRSHFDRQSHDRMLMQRKMKTEKRMEDGRRKTFHDTKSHGPFTGSTGDPVSPLTLLSNYSANISPTAPNIVCISDVRRRRCIHFVCT